MKTQSFCSYYNRFYDFSFAIQDTFFATEPVFVCSMFNKLSMYCAKLELNEVLSSLLYALNLNQIPKLSKSH